MPGVHFVQPYNQDRLILSREEYCLRDYITRHDTTLVLFWHDLLKRE